MACRSVGADRRNLKDGHAKDPGSPVVCYLYGHLGWKVLRLATVGGNTFTPYVKNEIISM